MYLMDYHLHSHYSFDGVSTILQICEAAIGQGIREIAITEHMDIIEGAACDWQLDMNGLMHSIANAREKYKGALSIRYGMELGQPLTNPDAAEDFYQNYPVDFIIGSIHNLESNVDVGNYNYSAIDCEDLYGTYLDRLIELARFGDFDVLGHLTYPLRYQHAQTGKMVALKPFEEKFRELFSVLAERKKGIEVNTSGLRQTMGVTMPDEWILKLYKKCGGTILTVGSDAHYPKDVGSGIREGMRIIRNLGFESVTRYKERVAKSVWLPD